jgi:feruloyl-CoA synthase
LIFLDPRNACAVARMDQAKETELMSNSSVRAAVQQVLDGLARQATGSSTFVARALILAEPPDAAAGEVTDKGTVSQKVTLRNRADAVSALHGGTTSGILLADAGQEGPDQDRKQVK